MGELQRLIEAVERGFTGPTNWRNFEALIPDVDVASDLPIYAHRAYHGDLNAAAALHKNLLPDWRMANLGNLDGGWECRLVGPGPSDGAYASGPTLERAWLLAILRAVEAKGGVV